MKNIRRAFLWWALLTKRLLRRPAYVALLLLIPAFALALTLAAGRSEQVLSVALVLEEPASEAALRTAERLESGESLLRCTRYAGEREAMDALRDARADAVWILHADLEQQLQRFARRGSGLAVTVWQREDNALLALSREKLFAALYPDVSRALFRDYLVRELGAEEPEEDELRRFYAGGATEERILRFETAAGRPLDETGSVLTAPLRGMMAVLIVLCGMASGLGCYAEEREESFVWLSPPLRRALPLLSHLAAMLPAALAAIAALWTAGEAQGLGRELGLWLSYLPAAALFCELLRCFCPREEHYGALIPILTAAMLLLCPVFFALRLPPALRGLLPPAQLLAAFWGGGELGLYTLALLGLAVPAMLLRQKRQGR